MCLIFFTIDKWIQFLYFCGSLLEVIDMSNEELINFRKNIEDIARNKTSSILSNDSPEQANVIIANIFRHAENRVRIFAKNLDGEISSNAMAGNYYFNALDEFLGKPNSTLDVLIEESPAKESFLFAKLKQKSSVSNQVRFKFASEEFKEEVRKLRPEDQPASQESELLHFVVGDNSMFRIEYDLKSHKANFCFNNEEVSTQLNKLFEDHIESKSCVPIVTNSSLQFRNA